MQKNFESHVFAGYYLKVMKKLTYKQEQEEQTG